MVFLAAKEVCDRPNGSMTIQNTFTVVKESDTTLWFYVRGLTEVGSQTGW